MVIAWFMVSACVSWALCHLVCRRLVKWNIIDHPNERSSHSIPTARGGGIGILLVVLAGAGILMAQSPAPLAWAWIAGSALALAVISFADDLLSLPSAVRFGCHVAASLAALQALDWPRLRLELAPGLGWTPGAALGFLLALIWIAGYTNVFNFMDGINGLAAGQAVVTALGSVGLVGLATGQWHTAPLLFAGAIAGAAGGFLPHNFPAARMFMGDVGSAPLGFLLAVLALWLARDHGWWLLLPLALLHANFVLDSAITLLRRAARGEKWYQAHREHFYQRLNRSGKTHTCVTGWEMGLQLGVVALLLLYLRAAAPVRAALALLVAGLWGGFFLYCERSFRRATQLQGASAAPQPLPRAGTARERNSTA